MSTQLEALGIALTEGYDAAQLAGVARGADVFVVGNALSRGQSAHRGDSRRGPAVPVGAAVALRARARRQVGARGRRHARQDDDDVDARVDPRARRPRSGIPDRRRAAQFRRFGAPDRQRVLRDRGRRIRHGLLRQALEVRPLPAAHRDPQQPRIRPRRHLRGRGRHRDPVPPPRPHRAAVGASRRQRRGAEPRARAGARRVVRSRALRRRRVRRDRRRGAARLADRRRRRGDPGRGAAGHRPLAARSAAARPAQPPERAGRARGCAARGRPGRRGTRGAGRIRRHQAPPRGARHGGRRHRLRRLRASSDGDRDDGRRAPARGGQGAHPRGAGAAIEHDEAGRDEGRAAGKPRRRRPDVLLRGEARLGSRRRARAARREGRRARRSRRPGRGDRWPRRAPAITCW